jgi:hypothetical protein
VKVDANLALYCFLSKLESRFDPCGSLPDTIFYQIDSGAQDATIEMIAMCELLVARRLTNRIYLTRMRPGHPVGDLVADFAHIWNECRDKQLLTPHVSCDTVAFPDSCPTHS